MKLKMFVMFVCTCVCVWVCVCFLNEFCFLSWCKIALSCCSHLFNEIVYNCYHNSYRIWTCTNHHHSRIAWLVQIVWTKIKKKKTKCCFHWIFSCFINRQRSLLPSHFVDFISKNCISVTAYFFFSFYYLCGLAAKCNRIYAKTYILWCFA